MRLICPFCQDQCASQDHINVFAPIKSVTVWCQNKICEACKVSCTFTDRRLSSISFFFHYQDENVAVMYDQKEMHIVTLTHYLRTIQLAAPFQIILSPTNYKNKYPTLINFQ